MKIPRLTVKEFHETRFCPGIWRDGLTDFLSFIVIYSHIYDPAVEMIAQLLIRQQETRIVDLCSGGALYNRQIYDRLSRHWKIRLTDYKLTDVAPNRHWKNIAKLSNQAISAEPESLSADAAIRKLPGLHIMFSALHHFSPEELQQLLTTGAQCQRTLAFFDYSQRKPLLELIPLLLAPMLLLLTSPLVYPFSWRRLFFTYLVPALPVLLFVDGLLSRLRSYTLPELQQIAAEVALPDYEITTGIISRWGGIGKIHWIIAHPTNLQSSMRSESASCRNAPPDDCLTGRRPVEGCPPWQPDARGAPKYRKHPCLRFLFSNWMLEVLSCARCAQEIKDGCKAVAQEHDPPPRRERGDNTG